MNEFRADLHCHSTCSDGTLSPQEILTLAKEKGLQGLSITDHDSIDAYPAAFAAAEAMNIALIPGVEFSTVLDDVSIHVLAYAFNLQHPELQDLCRRHRQRRQKRNQAILDRLAADNIFLDIENLIHNSQYTIGRPHIAQALVKKGYADSIADAFKYHLGEGKPYFVRGDIFSVEETLSIIHQAKGFALIAHPHLIKNKTIISKLMQMPFDGLEGYYAKLDANQNARWVKMGNQKKWLITGGSDFHGDVKPSIGLGSAWTNAETFEILHKRFIQNNA